MLTVHYSNQLETLAEALAAVTRVPLGSPFSREVVVVQSRGVARWLSLRLADHAGVCANVHFPFPNAYAWALYRNVLGETPETSPFEPKILTWRILRHLPDLEARPEFAPVREYTGNDALRRYELAVRLADLFDQYLLYRPEWMREWEKGGDKRWQPLLWRVLAKEAGTPHRARLHAELLERLRNAGPVPDLPERISMFGAPALPPALLELFEALAGHTDVHLFLQNPCREYWGDIREAKDIARKRVAGTADAALLETGNRLLASLGKQGRDLFDLLIETDTGESRDEFVEPRGRTLLASIQSDILNLRDRPAGTAVDSGDRSLQIHACHSPMREVEVLRDQLLALFAAHRDVEPADVVVMTPDIERYAPYVEAVFGTAEPRIPFNISDRSAEHVSTMAATFTALLDLAGSRYEANSVLAILDETAVRRRFALAEADLDTIARWVREAQIRWGIDGAHRARLGLPATHEHTWRFGLDRLLLGYALPGGGERLFANVSPYDEVEGSLGQVLGRFQRFAEAAIALDSELAKPGSIDQWAERLHEMLERFFDPPEDREYELEAVRSAVTALKSDAGAADFGAPVPLAVVKSALRARLEVPGRAFLSGGVTFCAMVPMRTLPFEIVCMIGMNDGAFPRAHRPFGFDLMAEAFRKGDRSRRDDDRYLFLESLLSARRCLYLSYTGRNIRDDSVVPPSVLVSELLDYVGDENTRKRLVTVHPLQAFSSRYFQGDDRLFSYSEASLRAAAALAQSEKHEPQAFIPNPLPEPEGALRSLDLESLIRFFRNPARYLCRERLNIRLETAEEEIEGREPFTLDSLVNYGLKQRLLDRTLRKESGEVLALARAAGVLPHGTIGEVLFQRERDAVEAYAAKLVPLLPRERLDAVAIDIDLGDARLLGTLANVSARGLMAYRAANVTANDRVASWIRHLALNAAAPPGVERVTTYAGQDCVLRFGPIRDARDRLRELLDLYFEGMRRPLAFFPRTSCEYSKGWEVSYKVRNIWYGSDHSDESWGDRDDPYYQLAFRGEEPLRSADFDRVARAVFAPMVGALEEGPLK